MVTGATGFVGGRLARALRESGAEVRCVVRDAERGRELAELGCELHEGDVTRSETLGGAGDDVDVAYFLVHLMGRGASGDFVEAEARAARGFAETCRREGVGRVVYLGGLGDPRASKHLRSRHESAIQLAEHGPPLTYFRAAMVVGARSESYRTLRYLVQRLPVMVAPGWLRTLSQPIGIDDTVAYLAAAPAVPASVGREVQIGGPDVLSYTDMLDEMARALGRRTPPKLPVPLLSPQLSSLWLGLVTPVDTGVARPLVESLRSETRVTDPAGAAVFAIEPAGFRETLRRALREDEAYAD